MYRKITAYLESASWVSDAVTYTVFFLISSCMKGLTYVFSTFMCTGTGTGSTHGYRVCNELNLYLPLLLDLLLPLAFIASAVLLFKERKRETVFRSLCLMFYLVYACASPFVLWWLWRTPFFLSWP
jgi:hypothetical protein